MNEPWNVMKDAFVTIEHFEDPLRADNAKRILEAANIPVLFLDRHLPGYAKFGNIAGTVKLQVQQKDAEKAIQIIAPLSERNDPEPEANAHNEPIVDECRCLSCGEYMSKDVDICGVCGWSYGA